MEILNSGTCRKTSCANQIPQSLASEQLCLDHYLDEAFTRTDEALQRSRSGRPIDTVGLETMLADALTIVTSLDDQSGQNDNQRDRMLELLLILANLHEHIAHGAIPVIHPA
jgi:hypothetical protein